MSMVSRKTAKHITVILWKGYINTTMQKNNNCSVEVVVNSSGNYFGVT